MAKSTQKKRKIKGFNRSGVSEFRIQHMPNEVLEKILYHQNNRMIGKKSRGQAAVNLIMTGVQHLELRDQIQQ